MKNPVHILETELPLPRVRIRELDLEGGPLCASFGSPGARLIESIREVGVLNPPLVAGRPEGGFAVVCGFKRLRALLSLGEESCACRDLAPLALSPLELLRTALLENLAVRELCPVEKAMALARLVKVAGMDETLKSYMPTLGLPARRDTLNAYLALEGAEFETKDAISRGGLSFKAFQSALDLSKDERGQVLAFLAGLKYSFNNQLQVIELLKDISEDNGMSIADVLDTPEIGSLLGDGSLNQPQKSSRILDHLRTLRSPAISRAEKDFERMVAACGLPKGVRIDHPPYFEGADLRMEIRFRSGPELVDTLSSLSGNRGVSALGMPWEVDEP